LRASAGAQPGHFDGSFEGMMPDGQGQTIAALSDPFAAGALDPFPCFHAWFAQAQASEPNDANAMALATADAQGAPSVRMVLLKDVAASGFVFYTNGESRKGHELRANPQAALCLHWKSLRRQVRIEGAVTEVSAQQADAYFRTRSRASQIGAAASRQSQPLQDRAVLAAAAAELERTYPGEVPRPAQWTGFSVYAERIEFWRDGAHRLHDRMLYTRTPQGWERLRLYP
jgi:pyridoxamine 5'-phosphate oxidase